MAIVRGQVSGSGTTGWVSNSASGSTAWTVNPAAGQTVLVFVSLDVAHTVADNGTTPATWVQDASTLLGHGANIWRAENITLPSAGQFTVTATAGSGTHTIVLQGVAYTGIKSGGPVATNTGSATNTAVLTSSVTGNAGGLYFGGFSDKSGLNPETITFNSGATFAEFLRNTDGANFWPGAAADAIIGGGGSQSISWTLGDSVIWGAAIAVYDAAPAAGGAAAQALPGKTWRRRFHHPQALPSLGPVSNDLVATAGVATSSVVAPAATVADTATAGVSTATAAAPAPVPAVTATAGVAAALAVAPAPVPAVTATAGVAAVSAAATAATTADTATAGIPTATAVAPAPVPAVTATAGVAAVSAVAPPATAADTATAGVAVSLAAAPPATVADTATAGVGIVGATAPSPTVSTSGNTNAPAQVAASQAAATAAVPAVQAQAGVATVLAVARPPTLTLVASANAQAAVVLAQAPSAIPPVAFTVGALTAQTAPGATLTASVALGGPVGGAEYGGTYSATYGPQEGVLTASDTRTGGPG